MDIVSKIIALFSPTLVYEATYQAALYVSGFVTPILLIIAVYVRTLEGQIQAMTGQSRWTLALRDMGIWTTVLVLYFSLGAYVVDLFNAFYGAFSRQGSLAVVMDQFQAVVSEIQLRKDESGFLEAAGNLLLAPVSWLTFAIYFFTLLILTTLTIFFRFALAAAFALAFIWGFIAIPISITQSVKLLRGWGMLLGGVLLWPIIEALLLAFFIPVFSQVSEYLVTNAGYLITDDQAAVFFLFAVLNLVIIAILIAAPFVAAQLVLNSSSIFGMVAPFMGAGISAGTLAAKSFITTPKLAAAGTRAGIKHGPAGMQKVGDFLKNRMGQASSFGVSSVSPESGSIGTNSKPTSSQANSSSHTKSSQNTDSVEPNEKPRRNYTGHQRQQRRGAVLDRLHKKGNITLRQRGR